MELGLRGRTAVVTGASKGIGRAIARALADEGVDLAICARTATDIERAAVEIADDTGGAVHPFADDLSHSENVQRFATFAVERLGRADILVNNAGAIPAATFDNIDDDTCGTAHDLKLWGYIRLSRALLPAMKQRRSGAVLNIIGNAGRQPSAGYIAGGPANAALMSFTKGLAADAGPYGIRVNAINPGSILTERLTALNAARARDQGVSPEEIERSAARGIPLGRVGLPEEVAAAAVFLVSDAASSVNSVILPVEGGATLGS